MAYEYLSEYLAPYWKGNTVFRESVLFRRDRQGAVLPASLLYQPREILSVMSATTEVTYTENTDYDFTDGILTLPPSSSIPCQDHQKMYPPAPLENNSFPKTGGGYLFFSEGDVFHRMQTLVTYTHDAVWEGPVPSGKGHLLPRVSRKIMEKEPLLLLILGDSISEGANSSGPVGVPPYLGSWWQLVAAYLEQCLGIPVTCKNVSMGGQVSGWGADQARKLSGGEIPDLALIAFGMNDGSHKIPPETFRDNIKSIIHTILSFGTETEFLLVGSILPNPEARDFVGFQEENRDMLSSLEGPGIALADVTAMHKAFLQHKNYCDITGNNVNHLNDFTARLQAQVVLQTMGVSLPL